MIRNISNAALTTTFVVASIVFVLSADAYAQTPNRTRPTPTPTFPEVISRADDFPIDGAQIIEPRTQINEPLPTVTRSRTVEELEERIRLLEANAKKDQEAVQRRLMLNLDILTRAEQRSESLRKQLFEMIEKENSVRMRLDVIEIDMRPELIERSIATAGSLRPEELREARRKQLAAEQANLQSLLTEVQRNKSNLEINVQKADELVERLRIRVEKEIDDALTGPVENPQEDR